MLRFRARWRSVRLVTVSTGVSNLKLELKKVSESFNAHCLHQSVLTSVFVDSNCYAFGFVFMSVKCIF